MRAFPRKFTLRAAEVHQPMDEVDGHPGTEATTDSDAESSLSHLSEEQRIGLRDDILGGFFDNTSGELFRGFPIGADDLLVDVGCGGGGPISFAARFAKNIVAIDITDQALTKTRVTLEGLGVDLGHFEFVAASAEDIPLPSEHATRIMCMEVLEHVDDPRKALSELKRIGKPGALYLISVPDERSEILMKRIAPKAAYEKPHHIRTFSPEAFENAVSGAGLEILSHSYNGFFRAMWLAMFWVRHPWAGEESLNADPTEFTKGDPALLQWSRTWNDLLDTPMGQGIKTLLDDFLPKTQIIVARKP